MIYCENCRFFIGMRDPEAAKKFGQIYECQRGILRSPKPMDFCSKGEEEKIDVIVKREIFKMFQTDSLTELDELEVSAQKHLREIFDLNYKRLEEQQEGKRK